MTYFSPLEAAPYQSHSAAESESALHAPEENRARSTRAWGSYLVGLDGLRTVAIVSVLIAHEFEHVDLLNPAASNAERVFNLFMGSLGTFGVKLFFAISGYLICTRLCMEMSKRSGKQVLKGFYIRRAFRILPPLIPFLLVLAAGGFFGLLPVNWREIAAALFFYSNYTTAYSWYTAHFWSLAVEEHFYLGWAPLLTLLRPRLATVVAVLLIVGTFIFRPTILSHLSGFDYTSCLRQTQMQLDYFMFPCLLAIAFRSEGVRQKAAHWASARVLTVVLLLVPVSLFVVQKFPAFDGRSIQALALAVAVALISLNPSLRITRLLESPPIAWIGRRSYGIYIWQQLLFIPSSHSLAMKCLLFFPRFAVTLAIAEVSYRYLEQPLMAIGRRQSYAAN